MGVIIVAMVLGFTLIVVKMGLDYSRTKLQEIEGAPPDSTLLMSELEDMISAAVNEAVTPLNERIEALELTALPEGKSINQLAPVKEGSEPAEEPQDSQL